MRSDSAWPSRGKTSICTSAYGYTPMLKIFPCPANQVSVQPPLLQTRIGATLLMTRKGGRFSWLFTAVTSGSVSDQCHAIIDNADRQTIDANSIDPLSKTGRE